MYNVDNLYIPKTFAELEQDFLNQYNLVFSTTLTLEQFRYTNIYAVFLNELQTQLQNENNIGLLYSNLVSFIKSKQDFEIIPKGSTFTGLYNALKELLDENNKPLIKAINLADANTYKDEHLAGQASIVLEYENNTTNNNLIVECLANNAPVGVEYLGDIVATYTSQEGLPFVFKWQTWTTINIKVKLHCQYDRNFYGDQLNTVDIANNYYNNFNNLYKPGLDLLPAALNDISLFPSLRYVNTEISLDGGNTYLPLNQIILGEYNIKYSIANRSTDISIILDP